MYQYKPEDVDCKYCAEWRHHLCQAAGCPRLAKRICIKHGLPVIENPRRCMCPSQDKLTRKGRSNGAGHYG